MNRSYCVKTFYKQTELTTKRRRSSDDDQDSDIVKEKTGLKKRVSPPSIDTATTTEDNTLSAHPKKVQ